MLFRVAQKRFKSVLFFTFADENVPIILSFLCGEALYPSVYSDHQMFGVVSLSFGKI